MRAMLQQLNQTAVRSNASATCAALAAATIARVSRPRQTLRFNSCAVVGSAGTLRDRGFGAAIDAHDAVLRVNFAPLGLVDRMVRES